MKEIRSIMTVTFTVINKVEDNEVDECIRKNQDAEFQKSFTEMFARIFPADHVSVDGIQDFVRDIEEE